MAKIVYPLAQVQEVKQRRVEVAERVLKEKVQELEKEKEKLRQREEERNRVLNHHNEKLRQLREILDKESTSPKIQQMKVYLKVVKDKLKIEDKKVKDQQAQVEIAEKNVETARQEVIRKRLEVDKLEMHRKDWEKEMRKELEMEEGREHDEIGNIIYSLRQKQIEKR